MRNIARSSKFNIRVDFEKSYKSYLYDKNTNRKFLDVFGMYSSLPLTSDQSLEFDNKFCKFAA